MGDSIPFILPITWNATGNVNKDTNTMTRRMKVSTFITTKTGSKGGTVEHSAVEFVLFDVMRSSRCKRHTASLH